MKRNLFPAGYFASSMLGELKNLIFEEICQYRAEEIAAAQNTERLKLKKEIAQLEIRLKHVPTHETYAVRTRPSAHGDQ